MNLNIAQYIDKMKPISLKEMDSVSLMKRTDTKFVVPYSILPLLLKKIESKYRVLSIKDNRIMTYSSMYFDTHTNKFYLDHHNGKSNRTKIRIRNYVESDLFFLEIKQKNGKGLTNKNRIPLSGFEPILSAPSKRFIEEKTTKNWDLKPSILNNFNRVTLVNLEEKERVTIDLNLSFGQNGKMKHFENLVVIELKQERFNRRSALVKSLRSFGYNPYSISKYCVGMVSLNEDLKYNAFKAKIKNINKLIQE